MELTGKHYAVFAGLLVAVGMQLAGVEHGWADVTTPTFIGGTLVQVGTTLAALFIPSPIGVKP